jgi:hypothetical protein
VIKYLATCNADFISVDSGIFYTALANLSQILKIRQCCSLRLRKILVRFLLRFNQFYSHFYVFYIFVAINSLKCCSSNWLRVTPILFLWIRGSFIQLWQIFHKYSKYDSTVRYGYVRFWWDFYCVLINFIAISTYFTSLWL